MGWKDIRKAGAFISVTVAYFAFCLGCCLLLLSCRSVRTVVVPDVREVFISSHDTCMLRDSIYVQDSIKVEVVGDTVREQVYRTTYRDRWRDRVKTDTVIERDTVSVVVPVEKSRSDWSLPGRNMLFLMVAAALAIFILWPPARKPPDNHEGS